MQGAGSPNTSPATPTPPEFVFKGNSVFEIHTPTNIATGVLPVTPEFDARRLRAQKSEYDRSFWEQELYRRHPELEDLVARMDPVARAAHFAALFMPDPRMQPHETILSLISQHLSLLGLTETVAAMKESFALPITHPEHHPFSQLQFLLERGVMNAEKLWQIVLPGATDQQTIPETERKEREKALAAQVHASLGILSGEKLCANPLGAENREFLRNIIVDETTRLPKGGTFNQLMYAAATSYREFNEHFIDAFVMTYSGYVSPMDMFQKIQEAWGIVERESTEGDNKVEGKFAVLAERWLRSAYIDFDPILLRHITDWVAQFKVKRPMLHKRLKQVLRSKLVKRTRPKNKEMLSSIKLSASLFLSKFELSSLDVKDLAMQITMWTAGYYYEITPKELLGCAWMKPTTKHQSPNIVALTNKFCALGDWVVSEILYTKSIQMKVKLLRYFSALAQELWTMNNFFDAMAVATSLNSNSIYRLQWHRKLAGDEANQIVDKIMDATKSDNNFAELLSIHDRGLKSGPTFPYIGVYLTQLVYMYDGNPDFLEKPTINFTKCFGIYKVIHKILSFQSKQFNFVEIAQIQEKLMALTRLDESKLYAKSLRVEPPEVTEEQFKAQYDKEAMMYARASQGARRSSMTA